MTRREVLMLLPLPAALYLWWRLRAPFHAEGCLMELSSGQCLVLDAPFRHICTSGCDGTLHRDLLTTTLAGPQIVETLWSERSPVLLLDIQRAVFPMTPEEEGNLPLWAVTFLVRGQREQQEP
jgi:hypothetical protein